VWRGRLARVVLRRRRCGGTGKPGSAGNARDESTPAASAAGQESPARQCRDGKEDEPEPRKRRHRSSQQNPRGDPTRGHGRRFADMASDFAGRWRPYGTCRDLSCYPALTRRAFVCRRFAAGSVPNLYFVLSFRAVHRRAAPRTCEESAFADGGETADSSLRLRSGQAMPGSSE